MGSVDICRLCRDIDSAYLNDIFDIQAQSSVFPDDVASRILYCTELEITKEDKYSTSICHRCIYFVDRFYTFKKKCHKINGDFETSSITIKKEITDIEPEPEPESYFEQHMHEDDGEGLAAPEIDIKQAEEDDIKPDTIHESGSEDDMVEIPKDEYEEPQSPSSTFNVEPSKKKAKKSKSVTNVRAKPGPKSKTKQSIEMPSTSQMELDSDPDDPDESLMDEEMEEPINEDDDSQESKDSDFQMEGESGGSTDEEQQASSSEKNSDAESNASSETKRKRKRRSRKNKRKTSPETEVANVVITEEDKKLFPYKLFDMEDKEILTYGELSIKCVGRVNCRFCKYSIETYEEMRDHSKEKHDIGLIECTHCFCLFGSPISHNSHSILHAGDQPTSYYCEVCGSAYQDQEYLTRHKSICREE